MNGESNGLTLLVANLYGIAVLVAAFIVLLLHLGLNLRAVGKSVNHAFVAGFANDDRIGVKVNHFSLEPNYFWGELLCGHGGRNDGLSRGRVNEN